MSEISKNIRKITEAWGGKTTGSGIGDAVMDLYNSLPFYAETKVVAIVPEQSILGELNDQGKYYCAPLLIEGGFYKCSVILNGVTYQVEYNQGAFGNAGILGGPPTSEPFVFYNSLIYWNAELGETITLAIYEEKEIVKPLDPKYTGVMIVKITPIYSGEFKGVELDKTYEEIHDAQLRGIPVIGTDGEYMYTFEGSFFVSNGNIASGHLSFISHSLNFVNEEVGTVEVRKKIYHCEYDSPNPYWAVFFVDELYENVNKQVAYI
jgi:hypothetical protein